MLSLALALLAQAPITAQRGGVDVEIGLDYLRASSSVTAATGVGPPGSFALQEAGMRLRLEARELQGRLRFDADYQGREPLPGDFENSPLRLLYRAEISFDVSPALTIHAGRFDAPSLTFLIIDGAKVDLRVDKLVIAPFGGRRAISASRRQLDFSEMLPAAGVYAGWIDRGLRLEAAGIYDEDQPVLTKGSSGEFVSETGAASAYARAFWRIDQLMAGGHIGFAQRASYVLGPTWTDVTIEAQALDLWNGVAFLEWRPERVLRLGYHFHTQNSGVFRAATESPVVIPGFEPYFTDNRLIAAYRVLDRAWLRGDGRLRLRKDRKEWRGGASLEADDLGVDGLHARVFAALEDVVFDEEGNPDLDRFLWSAAAGWRADFGLEIEAGASFVDLASGPLSGRFFDRAAPGEPSSPEDLAPFTLETQQIFFARAFYADELWFGGIDFEQSLQDSELRLFLQLGLIVEAAW